MARPKKAQRKAPPQPSSTQPYYLENDAPWGGFINIRLDEEQKTQFHEWYANGELSLDDTFDDMLAMGLKFSFSYDEDHECFVCSVTGALVGGDPESRYSSNSRAGTRREVMGLTIWKHYALCEGDYGNYAPKTGAFLSWG